MRMSLSAVAQTTMASIPYPIPSGLHAIPNDQLDLRSDAEVDESLIHPPPITSEKNVWFFWHSGYHTMHAYSKRNIRAWHRRFSQQGWTIRVLDRVESSPLNVANFIDATDPSTFPKAFINNTLSGEYARQHTSDLVRFPLLLRFGGVYADVGLMQIGDLDRLWNETIRNPNSRFEVLSYHAKDIEDRGLMNYFLAFRPRNPFFERCHRLLLALWAAEGGKTTTTGMRNSPLLKGLPLQGDPSFTKSVQEELTDYIIQGHAMTMVMALVDEEDGWNGPNYVAEHVYGIEFMGGSQLINEITSWDGKRAFELMSLKMPEVGEEESEEQKLARTIVERCLRESFGFKLATGLILKVLGDTLSSLWRKHEGSDDVEGTYAHWLRYGTTYWNQDHIPPTVGFKVLEPYKKGPLLREE